MDLRRRSRTLYVLVLCTGVALLAAGWYQTGSADETRSDRYVEGVVGRPQYPTPLFARSNPVDADLSALLFSGLTRITADGSVVPDLAERWDVTPDGLTYTFLLRPNLGWHDGAHLTSADVAFTIGSVQGPGFQGPSSLAARWAGVEVLTPDERTVVFRLPGASAAFLSLASLGIVPRHLLGGRGPAELIDVPIGQAAIGSGPFRLVSLDAARAVLAPNATYHFGPPRLSELEVRFYADEQALVLAITEREVDGGLLAAGSSGAAASIVAARPGLQMTPLVETSYTVLYVNNQREPLFDPALRRALAASIDRSALIPDGSTALPGDGPIVPGSWAYVPGGWNALAQAEALFIAAGWRRGEGGVLQRDGQPLRLELLTNDAPERTALADAIAQQLRTHGVQVSTRAMPAGDLLRNHIDTREYDLLLFGWQADADPDPYGGWHTSQIASGGRNIAGFHDPESDKLLEQARLTLDVIERRELYAQWLARWVELAPSVVVHYPRRVYIQPRDLRGHTAPLLVDGASRFHDVTEWHFDDTAPSTATPAP